MKHDLPYMTFLPEYSIHSCFGGGYEIIPMNWRDEREHIWDDGMPFSSYDSAAEHVMWVLRGQVV